jgi:hypothetical protein
MSLEHKNRLKWLVFCAILLVVVASSSSASHQQQARRPPPPSPQRRLFSFRHARQEQHHDQNNNNDITSDTEPTQEEPLWKDDTATNKEPLMSLTNNEKDYSEEQSDDHHHDETLLHSHHHVSLLQVCCTLQIASSGSNTLSLHKQHAVTTIVDTGAQVTVLSFQAAQACGLSHLIDLRYAGHATGVGSCRVVGRIPAGALVLRFGNEQRQKIIPSPAITVLEEHDLGVHLLLGLDFLRDHGAILSLQQECMILTLNDDSDEEQTVIPFLKPHYESKKDETIVGWINRDILASLGGSESSSTASEHYHYSDDEDGRDDDYDHLDMSGV